MLKALVRVAGVAIAAMVALIAGVFMAAADLDGLPNASHVASVDFQNSPNSRAEIVAAIDDYVDAQGVEVVLVTGTSDDFLNERIAFQFGDSGDGVSAIDFFSPTMSGSIVGSDDMATTALDGVYALTASSADVDAFVEWLRSDLGASAEASAKSPESLLAYALLTVGGWAPMGAALLLLGATVITWSVVRARARELSLLGGMPSRTVVLIDLRTLLAALGLPALIVSAAAVVAVALLGFGRVWEYTLALAAFFAVVAAVTVALAVAAGIVTMPSVDRIATRKPATGDAWVLSELLKVICVVLVAAIVPVTALLTSAASAAEREGETWARLGDAVSLRIGLLAYPTAAEAAEFGALVRDEAASGSVLFSMSLSSDRMQLVDDTGRAALEELGYDGIVMANTEYLDATLSDGVDVIPASSTPTVGSLPPDVARLLTPTLALWVPDGAAFDPPLQQLPDGESLPVFASSDGSMVRYESPLIVAVEDMTAFRDDFLTSALSTDNIAFTDADSVVAAAAAAPLDSMVLSVDRVADLGLYSAQTEQRNAQLAIAAVALAVLALIVSTSVAAWIYALLRRRRWFVERTAGRQWTGILSKRMIWELCAALVLSATMYVSLRLVAPSIELPSLVAAGSGLALWLGSWLVHLVAARRVVYSTISRRG